ncbi:hypothetical protein PRUPE_8G118900, partial [Prunus persica]
MASSAAAIPPQEKYDVFLSFRGEDTRYTFTSHLYAALCSKKIKTYIDDIIERGEQIAPALFEAIETSKLSMIIFSKNYASSTWCLDELFVLPIFYCIDPSHVRNQQGSYAYAFAQLETRFKDSTEGVMKVRKWRDALKATANMAGFDNSNKRGTEANFIENIVEDFLTKLNFKSIEQIEGLLCINSPDVFTTTLADAVYHRLSSKFEASCFLANVREELEKHGLKHLQNVLQRLSHTKVLIALDDVNDSKQLELLVVDYVRFGPGSRIIITTRYRRLLKKLVDADKIYEVEGLYYFEALELFHLHALKHNCTETCYTEVFRMVVDYDGGMPLALKILSSIFLHCDNNEDWKDEKLKKFPNQDIENMLRLTCFYKGMTIDFAKEMIDISGLFAGGIKVLIDKSLVSISRWNNLEMHDLVQEMGRAIGTETVRAIFFNRSKIGEPHLDCADFKKMSNLCLLNLGDSSFGNYCQLKVSLPNYLCYLSWQEYPLKSMPSIFFPENLVELRMHSSKVEQLWNKDQNLENLKVMDLSFSTHLIKVPDLSQSRKLVRINLFGCISSYFQCLDKLTHLDLGECSNLKYLPQMTSNSEFLNLPKTAIKELPSSVWSHDKISYLDIRFCNDLRNLPSSSYFPEILEPMGHLNILSLKGTAVKELPSSIKCLFGLMTIELTNCKRLAHLPPTICKLKSLPELDLTGCSEFQDFPEILEPMKDMKFLSLKGTAVKELPSSIECLFGLIKIELKNCKRFASLPTSISPIKSLKAHGCTSLNTVSSPSTALTHGLDGYNLFPGFNQELIFSNCLKLDQNTWNHIMADAQLRIMHLAFASSKFDKFEVASYAELSKEIEVAADVELEAEFEDASDVEFSEEIENYYTRRPSVTIVCPGHEIPNWFSYQNEGSSINIKLPPDWFDSNFLGFALSLVVGFDNYNVKGSLGFGCKFNFKANNGESCEFESY